MVAIWKEKGEWDKEAYTAEHFDSYEELRSAAKIFQGVCSVVAVYGDTTKENALRWYFEDNKAR